MCDHYPSLKASIDIRRLTELAYKEAPAMPALQDQYTGAACLGHATFLQIIFFFFFYFMDEDRGSSERNRILLVGFFFVCVIGQLINWSICLNKKTSTLWPSAPSGVLEYIFKAEVCQLGYLEIQKKCHCKKISKEHVVLCGLS